MSKKCRKIRMRNFDSPTKVDMEADISSGTLEYFLLMAFHTLSFLYFPLPHFQRPPRPSASAPPKPKSWIRPCQVMTKKWEGYTMRTALRFTWSLSSEGWQQSSFDWQSMSVTSAPFADGFMCTAFGVVCVSRTFSVCVCVDMSFRDEASWHVEDFWPRWTAVGKWRNKKDSYTAWPRSCTVCHPKRTDKNSFRTA